MPARSRPRLRRKRRFRQPHQQDQPGEHPPHQREVIHRRHHVRLAAEHLLQLPVRRAPCPAQLGGAGGASYRQLEQMLSSQAYMMSTVDYFTLMGWVFAGLILLVWLAKPPFAAKAGPASGGH